MSLQEIKSQVDRLAGRRDQLLETQQKDSRQVKRLGRHQERIEEARVLLQIVAKETQEQLRYHIEEIVSLALDAVFDDPYELEVEFVQKRGRTECELWFVRDEERIQLPAEGGGGPSDVASFALRVALWSLKKPQTRACLVLDEPFKFVNDPTGEMQHRCSEMLAELAKNLGIQFIIVTLDEALTEQADKTFSISKRKGITTIKEE